MPVPPSHHSVSDHQVIRNNLTLMAQTNASLRRTIEKSYRLIYDLRQTLAHADRVLKKW